MGGSMRHLRGIRVLSVLMVSGFSSNVDIRYKEFFLLQGRWYFRPSNFLAHVSTKRPADCREIRAAKAHKPSKSKKRKTVTFPKGKPL